VSVALLVAGVDALGLDADRDLGIGRVVAVQVAGALELVERAAHLRHHRVAGDETDAGVAGVERVLAGQGGERGGGCGHGELLVFLVAL